MPTPAIDILCAKLGEVCYLPDFIGHPSDVSAKPVEALGRDLVDLVMGVDPKIGAVPFGIITDGPDGKVTTLRGTQMPPGAKLEEWRRDFQAWLDTCRLCRVAHWHHGFHAISDSLYVGTGKPLAVYMVENGIKIIEGHSLGGPLATNIGAEAAVHLAVVVESPNPGDPAFRDFVTSRISEFRSYWNPRDIIGRIPFDVDILPPWLEEDFVPVVQNKTLLDPNSVTPAVPDSLWDNHNLTNCRRMMEAAA